MNSIESPATVTADFVFVNAERVDQLIYYFTKQTKEGHFAIHW